MPVKTYKDQQNATIFSIILTSLIMAIFTNVEYNNTDNHNLKTTCKKWFTICYSISGVCLFLQILFNKKPHHSVNSITSVPV